MLCYTLAQISIIALRVKEPNLPRPFKIRLNVRISKKDIPITALIGGLGTGITWFIVLYTHHFGRIVGFAWIGVGVLIYIYIAGSHISPSWVLQLMLSQKYTLSI